MKTFLEVYLVIGVLVAAFGYSAYLRVEQRRNRRRPYTFVSEAIVFAMWTMLWPVAVLTMFGIARRHAAARLPKE